MYTAAFVKKKKKNLVEITEITTELKVLCIWYLHCHNHRKAYLNTVL